MNIAPRIEHIQTGDVVAGVSLPAAYGDTVGDRSSTPVKAVQPAVNARK